MEQNTIIDNLLKEYNDHRKAIKEMIVDLERIRANIDKLFPQNLDIRHVRFFEEKIKTLTSLFNSLLDMRKEIAKSVKDEIEIRRRVEKSGEDDFEDFLDIRKIAKKVENFQKKKEEMKKDNPIKEVM